MTNNSFKELELTAGGGTYLLYGWDKVSTLLLTGAERLSSNWTIDFDSADLSYPATAGMSIVIINNSTTDVNGNTVTLFGTDVSYIIDSKFKAECLYDGTDWIVNIYEASL